MKWDKQIEPLKYSESQQVFLESLEKVSLNVSDYYFDLLIAQVNLQIAEKNRSNNDTLYKIASKGWNWVKFQKMIFYNCVCRY